MATLDLGFTPAASASYPEMDKFDAASYSVKERNNGQIVLINVTSPLDRVQTLRIQSREIPDVYKGAGISPTATSPNRSGRNVATVFSYVLKVEEANGLIRHLPMKASLSITIPNDAAVTAAHIGTLLEGAFTSWSDPADWSGSDNTFARALALCKGALEPKLI